jgi:transposase
MSTSSRNRKKLAANLRDQAKELKPVVDKIPDVGDMSIIVKAVALLNSGLDRIPGILPSERPHLMLAKEMIALAHAAVMSQGIFPKFLGNVEIACQKLAPTTSKNSNLPPGKEIHRPKSKKDPVPKDKEKDGPKRAPGAQPGHEGNAPERFEKPDLTVRLKVDRTQLPPGNWKPVGYMTRQVVSVVVKRHVVQYEAEILASEDGQKISAPIPYESAIPDDGGRTIGIRPAKDGEASSESGPEVEIRVVDASSLATPDDSQDGADAGEAAPEAGNMNPEAAGDEPLDGAVAVGVAPEAGNMAPEAAGDEPLDGAGAGDSADTPRLHQPLLDQFGRPIAVNHDPPASSCRGGGAQIEMVVAPPVKVSDYKVMAKTPDGVGAPVQFTNSVKIFALHQNITQLIPFMRTADSLQGLFGVNVSPGSIYTFRHEAVELLNASCFKEWAKSSIINSPVIHSDETGLNVAGTGCWLHIASSKDATLLEVFEKRDHKAMVKMGILPFTGAVICHDCYNPYFKFDQTLHCLCNVHITRELQGLIDKFGVKWAPVMRRFLLDLNKEVKASGGCLDHSRQIDVRSRYRDIILMGEMESPKVPPPPGWRGRYAQSDARNLLERLVKYENEILRFMTAVEIPFSNNQAEREIRMVKVRQKISGCFRTINTANEYALFRSYLLTCEKHGLKQFDAMQMLLDHQLPSFMVLGEAA